MQDETEIRDLHRSPDSTANGSEDSMLMLRDQDHFIRMTKVFECLQSLVKIVIERKKITSGFPGCSTSARGKLCVLDEL